MTANKNKKRLVRARMAKTGESHQTANRAISTAAIVAVVAATDVDANANATSANASNEAFVLQYKGHLFALSEDPFTIGRNASCNLLLDDALVSRVHATFRVEDGRVQVVDHDSRNGVLLNGHRIAIRADVSLGDAIVIGKSELTLAHGVGTKTNNASGLRDVSSTLTTTSSSAATSTKSPTKSPDRSASVIEVGSVLGGRYRLLRRLPPPSSSHALYGTQGSDYPWELYDAEHMLLGGGVTIKLLTRATSRLNPQLKVSLLREGRALQRAPHPHVIKVFDIGETDGEDVYLVLERMPEAAIPLDAYVEKMKMISSPDDGRVAFEIIVQLAKIFEHIHQHGVIHRGLHDGAVFVEARRGAGSHDVTVKLSSFSFATIAGDSPITADDAVLGHPAWMSPEQTRGRAVDARSDLYALGVALYRLLAQRLPFDDGGSADPSRLLEMQRNASPPPLHAVVGNGRVSSLDPICMKLLAKAPDDRYANAAALLDALRRAAPTW